MSDPDGRKVRVLVLFLGAVLAFGLHIARVEQMFYEVPYITLSLWLVTGILVFWPCDRSDL